MANTANTAAKMLRDAEKAEAQQAQALTQAQDMRTRIDAMEAELKQAKAALAAFVTAKGLKRSQLTPSADSAKCTSTKAQDGIVWPDSLPEFDNPKPDERAWRKAYKNGWKNDAEAHAKHIGNLTTDERKALADSAFVDGRAAAERRVQQLETAHVAV